MVELLSMYPIAEILIILILGGGALWKFWKWISGLYKEHKANQQAAYQQGISAEKDKEKEIERFEKGEARMTELEEQEKDLDSRLKKQEEQLESIVLSDQLDIKQQVKKTYEKVYRTRTIDSYDLDILEQRFKIYKARGGNGHTEALMKWIRENATVVTAYPVHNRFEDDDNE